MSALERHPNQYSSNCAQEVSKNCADTMYSMYDCGDQVQSMSKMSDNKCDEETSEKNPFNPKCQIPLPDIFGQFSLLDTTTFIRRRNERERSRVRNVNDAFEILRQHVPNGTKNKRMSKVETLRSAVEYIRQLKQLLDQNFDDIQ